MRRWLLLLCFHVTRKELDRWYRKHAHRLSHADWKENYQAIAYLKKYAKYQLLGKKEEGLKKPSSNPNPSNYKSTTFYRIRSSTKVNKPIEE